MKNRFDEIQSLYENRVSSYYAEQIMSFAKQKQAAFDWLFQGKTKLEIEISPNEAASWFYDKDQTFRHVVKITRTFLTESEAADEEKRQNICLAILNNRITYKRNTFKFSKFYKRFLITEEEANPVDMQQFYHRLKTAKCILSIDPLDFLSASEHCSYSSCYAIDSCHHTGCSAYLKDNFTIICYTVMNNKKIGRQWIYFNEHYIVFGYIYGAISKPLQDSIRETLEAAYAKHLGILDEWILRKGYTLNEDQLENCGHCENEHNDYPVYFDMDTEAVIRSKHSTSGFDDLFLSFEDGLDSTGNNAESGEFFNIQCACCGEPIYSERYETDDGTVCGECLDNCYTYCTHCDNYFSSDIMYHIEDEEIYLCSYCYDNGDYFYCEQTDLYWSTDVKVDVNMKGGFVESVCKQWAEDNAYYCEHCEEYHENPLTEIEGAEYCDDCLKEYFDVIDGKYLPKEENAA